MKQPPRIPSARSAKPPRNLRPPRAIKAPTMNFGVMATPSRSRGTGDWGQAIADALISNLGGQVSVDLPVAVPAEDLDQGVEDVKPTVGSILHYAPDQRGWLAELEDEEGSTWREPVVGWAVVVTWAKYAPESEDSERPEGDDSEFETQLLPMLFTDAGHPELMMFREDCELVGLIMPGLVTAAPLPTK